MNEQEPQQENLRDDLLTGEYFFRLVQNPRAAPPAELDPTTAALIRQLVDTERIKPALMKLPDFDYILATAYPAEQELKLKEDENGKELPIMYPQEPRRPDGKRPRPFWAGVLVGGLVVVTAAIAWFITVQVFAPLPSPSVGSAPVIVHSVMPTPTPVLFAPTVPPMPPSVGGPISVPPTVPPLSGIPNINAPAGSQGGYEVVLAPKNRTKDVQQLTDLNKVLMTRLSELRAASFGSAIPEPNTNTIGFWLAGNINWTPDEIGKLLAATGRVELIDTGTEVLTEGEIVQTTYCISGSLYRKQAGTCSPLTTPNSPRVNISGQPFQTIIIGEDFDISKVSAGKDKNSGEAKFSFGVKPAPAKILGEFTRQNIGKNMAVLVDNQVISSARINGPLSDAGEITGSNWPPKTAESLVIWLKSGALPLEMELVSIRSV
jgi:hypothetical protein